MKPPMFHKAYKVAYTTNAYNDKVTSTETELPCHVRIITTLQYNDLNQQITSDALMWFEPDSGVVKNDIIKFESEYYMVEKVTKARRLRNPVVLFIKCEMSKYGVIS